MTGLSRHAVIEDMAAQLNERRGARIERRAAYLALARAILADEPEAPAGPTSPDLFELGQPSAQTVAAA